MKLELGICNIVDIFVGLLLSVWDFYFLKMRICNFCLILCFFKCLEIYFVYIYLLVRDLRFLYEMIIYEYYVF